MERRHQGMEGGAAVSAEDHFAAFRRVAGEELDKLRTENAELRAHAERVGEANDRLVVENAALRAKIAELEHLLSPKP